MDNPRELILTDVRCFPGEQRASLRPITLLVGENNTGKTTLLGCYRVLQRAFLRPHDDSLPDFNASPEGEHVPMLMMRLTRADRSRWSSLREDLVAFGRESGLLSDIKGTAGNCLATSRACP